MKNCWPCFFFFEARPRPF